MPLRPHRFGPPARQDIKDIIRYYAVDKANPSAAENVVRAIRDTCKRAGEDPETGRARPDIRPGVRVKLVRGYPFAVYFRIAQPGAAFRVQILRILHQRRSVDPRALEDA